VPIHNRHTRQAYFYAASTFLAWCDVHGLKLETIEPIHVAAYIEKHPGAPTTIKQYMAALRMLFSWLVEKGVLPYNPAREVKTERYSRTEGKTPALSPDDMQRLFKSFDVSNVVGLRDRALIGVMAYTFARVEAVVTLSVKDYLQSGRRALIRLHEKGGKEKDIPCHHQLETYLDTYIAAAGIAQEKDSPLFRSAAGRTKKLSEKQISRTDAYAMVQRRCQDAGIEGDYSCHSFRATGITSYLENGGDLEKAQYIAGHADSRTTKLYDRRGQKTTLEDIDDL
jgi:site-specific recombinase XerD